MQLKHTFCKPLIRPISTCHDFCINFPSREKDAGHTLQIPEVGVSKVTLISVCWKVDQRMNEALDFMTLNSAKCYANFLKSLLELNVGLHTFEIRKTYSILLNGNLTQPAV